MKPQWEAHEANEQRWTVERAIDPPVVKGGMKLLAEVICDAFPTETATAEENAKRIADALNVETTCTFGGHQLHCGGCCIEESNRDAAELAEVRAEVERLRAAMSCSICGSDVLGETHWRECRNVSDAERQPLYAEHGDIATRVVLGTATPEDIERLSFVRLQLDLSDLARQNDELRKANAQLTARVEEDDVENLARVCPGCHTVAPERCLPGCIDAEIAAERREDEDLWPVSER